MQSQLAVWQHPTGIFSAFSQFSPSRTTWIRIFNFRATTLLAVNQHPVRVLIALACLSPVWALILMSIAISTHSTKDCRFRDHWRPWGCFGCCYSYEEKCFFQHFFFILNLVREFPSLEFFSTVILTQIFLQSRNPYPASRIPHPTSRNPHGYKYRHSASPAYYGA